MLVKRGYKAELDVNNEHITACLKHCGAARWAYNYALRRKQENYKAGLKTPYAAQLHKEVNLLKKDHPWMYDVSKCAFQEGLRDADDAFKHFFRKCKLKKEGKHTGKCGYPRFKSRKKHIGSARFTGSIHVYPDAIQLPRVGMIRLKERDYLPMNAKIGSATVGLYEFKRQILYKAAFAGSEVKLASRWYPSSKTCHCCGWVKEDLTLSDRVFVCEDCGNVTDRDYNAARNVASLA